MMERERSPWQCVRHPYMRWTYILVDTTGMNPFEDYGSIPDEKKIVLDQEQVLAVALAVQRDDTLERAVSSSFDKETIRKQFDLLTKAVDGLCVSSPVEKR